MVIMMELLKTNSLKKYYRAGDNTTKALDGVNLTVEKGEFISIVGSSGSGKSTLLHMLGGLDRPTEGEVTIKNKALFKMSDEELTIFRRREIGFVFQNYNLVPSLNVYENIVFPILLDGKEVDRAFISNIVEVLGINDKLNNLPNNLSGGQQQRVAIARALAMRPSIILADEPTGNLDSKTGKEVLKLLKSTNKLYDQTIIIITHDEAIAEMTDRRIHIEDGHIIGIHQ